MNIYIPTYGRAERQITYWNLPSTIQKQVTLVVQYRERKLYPNYNIAVLPDSIRTIAATREWIAYTHYPKNAKAETLLMLDDDLVFGVRRKDDPGKFLAPRPVQVEQMVTAIEHHLDLGKYAMVSVVPREGGNRVHKNVECSRAMRVLGYYMPTLQKHKISFLRGGPKFTMEDFDVTLQLLRLGYKNLLLAGWCQGQGSSNESGGCSSYRTVALHNKTAERLARMHPGLVKVVEKQTKTAWGGLPRKDVLVSWKKAYLSSGKAL